MRRSKTPDAATPAGLAAPCTLDSPPLIGRELSPWTSPNIPERCVVDVCLRWNHYSEHGFVRHIHEGTGRADRAPARP